MAETSHGIRLTSRIHPLRLPLELDEVAGWKPYQAFHGTTANLPWIKCHASVLAPGHSPHPPHAHDEEEILVLLSGEAELEFSDGETAALTPGQVAYYPAGFHHTLRATSETPAMYVMLKWRGTQQRALGEQGPHGRYDTTGPRRLVFEHSTRWLRKLHCHTTVLEPNDGYEPHADAYDVAIVVLEGAVETIGGRAVPHDVIFYVAGEEHGMRSVGEMPARYVVFELHGAPSSTGTEAHATSTRASAASSIRRRLGALGRRQQ